MTVVFMGLFMIFFILTVPPLRKELVRDLSANWFRYCAGKQLVRGNSKRRACSL